MHTSPTVPRDHITPAYLLENRACPCAWLAGSMLPARAAMNVSWFFVLFIGMDALTPCPEVLRYFWWILKVDKWQETVQWKGKVHFFPTTSLVLLACDQKKGLTWFSAVLSTHTSQWSWWEVQEITVFEIKPRIWLIMPWRRYLTTKWKYIQIEGTKAFLLNTLLWSNLLSGVAITKLQLLYSSYNSFIETISSVF